MDTILLKNFDILKSNDLFTLIICIYIMICLVFIPNKYFFMIQVIIWRLFHNGILGLILHYQSKNKFWSNIFINKGETNRDAFESWKKLYNMSITLNYFVFFCCVIKFTNLPTFSKFNISQYFLFFLLGVLLIGLNIWSSISSYEVLGKNKLIK
jgi:phosphatidylethanolamine N-methyltransferase